MMAALASAVAIPAVGFELESKRADAGNDIWFELDARHSRPGNPDTVVALEINEHDAAALETDLGVYSRYALCRILEDDVVLRSTPDANGQLVQVLAIARIASNHD